MHNAWYFALVLCWLSDDSYADLRSKDLSTVFGWEVENVVDDVSRSLAEGDKTFFATGGDPCQPIAVPEEWAYVVKSTFTIYCGHWTRQGDEEVMARMRHQLRYAAAYNRELLGRLTSFNLHPGLESVAAQLPSRKQRIDALHEIRHRGARPIESGGFFPLQRGAEARQKREELHLAVFGKYMDASVTKIGMVKVGHQAWVLAASRFPERMISYLSYLEEQPVWMTPVSTVRDEAIAGNHLTLAVETSHANGWMLLSLADDGVAVSGTLVLDGMVYRVVSMPNREDWQVLMHVDGYDTGDVSTQLRKAVASNRKILGMETRHQAMYARWR